MFVFFVLSFFKLLSFFLNVFCVLFEFLFFPKGETVALGFSYNTFPLYVPDHSGVTREAFWKPLSP